MSARFYFVIGGVLVAVLGAGLVTSKGKAWGQPQPPVAASADHAQATGAEGRKADEEAIRKQSEVLTRAFRKGDCRPVHPEEAPGSEA